MPYVVMERLHGRTLEAVLDEHLDMLAKDPKARPQSMDEVAWQLRRLRAQPARGDNRCSVVVAEDNPATSAILATMVSEIVPDADARGATARDGHRIRAQGRGSRAQVARHRQAGPFAALTTTSTALAQTPPANAPGANGTPPTDSTSVAVSAGGQYAAGNSRLYAATGQGKLDMSRGDNGFGAALIGNFAETDVAGASRSSPCCSRAATGASDFLIVALVLFVVVGKIVKGAEARFSKPATAVTKECPFCCEVVPLKAKRCNACTSELV